MRDLIQLLGQKERERIAVCNTPQEIEASDEVYQLILEMLQDEAFRNYVKLDLKKASYEIMVHDCLFAIGAQLLLSYQRIREDNETGVLPQDFEAQESLYYAASAFIHMSQTVRLSMLMDE